MKKENEEKYSLSDIIMLAVCTIVVVVCVIQLFLGFHGISYMEPEKVYSGPEDITVLQGQTSDLMQINKFLSYEENEITYVKFRLLPTEVKEDMYYPFKEYSFEQSQYTDVFGDNDGYLLKEYTLELTATVQDDVFIAGNEVDYLVRHKFRSRKDDEPSILRALVLASTNYMPCLSYMQDPDIIRAEAISTQYDTITVSLVVKRANFLGDTDYSEEDIEKYKNMVDNMCRDILRMINKEEPQLIWSTN